eukprot:2198850-Rhodomonas_salina.1
MGGTSSRYAVQSLRLFAPSSSSFSCTRARGSIPSSFHAMNATDMGHSATRYLLTQGRLREAEEVIQKINEAAGKGGRPARLKALISSEESTESFRLQFAKLIQPPLRSRFLLLSAVWMGICFGWYGLVLWIPTLLKRYGTELCWDNSDAKVNSASSSSRLGLYEMSGTDVACGATRSACTSPRYLLPPPASQVSQLRANVDASQFRD